MNQRIDQRKTKWDFYSLLAKIGIPLVVGGVLFFLATQGETLAIVLLAALGAILLAGLGVFVVLVILDKTAAREQIRFQNNVKENLALMQQVQSLQNQQLLGQVL